MTKQELDIWLEGCLTYYYKQTNTNMKTIDERINQLELAHSRLFNQQKEFIKDLQLMQDKLIKEVEQLSFQIKQLSSTEETGSLPDKLVDGRKYVGKISEVIGSSSVIWKSRNKEYTNYQLKLVGKDLIYIAFVPSSTILEPDMLVQFFFETPFNLKHCKIYEK